MMQHAKQNGRTRKLLDISPARLIRDDGVGGSNPLTPTIFPPKILIFRRFRSIRRDRSPRRVGPELYSKQRRSPLRQCRPRYGLPGCKPSAAASTHPSMHFYSSTGGATPEASWSANGRAQCSSCNRKGHRSQKHESEPSRFGNRSARANRYGRRTQTLSSVRL
jgi:hypothetical protein